MVGILSSLSGPARSVAIVLGLAFAALPACGVHGLSFVQDERVDIVAPRDRHEATLPVTVDWTVKDFPVGAGQGSFGVFVDRAPQPSGKTLAWLFRGDAGCRGSSKPLCAKRDFLAQRNVFSTTRTAFTVENVNRQPDNGRRRQFHEVTVVLLDHAGRRVGEGAWSVQFEVPKL